MPSITVDNDLALKNLQLASKSAQAAGYRPCSKHRKEIEAIVTGSHLTYRYLLVTALLAKATNSNINTLALQAGARLEGAYDARSLCHGVIVPHEPALLGNALGGSNEPFLNKPARYTHISLSNPVRQGNDRRTLGLLHGMLLSISDSREAFKCLQDAVYYAIGKKVNQEGEITAAVAKVTGGRNGVLAFIEAFISKSVQGETCALASGALFWLLAQSRGAENWVIEVHPVNECGASSNEISDIDVKADGTLIITAEVKDKTFTARDVAHAVRKVRKSGHSVLHFIKGPQAITSPALEALVVTDAQTHGVEVLFLDLLSFARSVVAFSPQDISVKAFVGVIRSLAVSAKAKTDTLVHLRSVLEALEP